MGAYINGAGGSSITTPISIANGGTNNNAMSQRNVLFFNHISGKIENGGRFCIGMAATTGASSVNISAGDNYGFIACYANTAGIAVNLPAGSPTDSGRMLFIKDMDGSTGGNTIVITPNGTETIDGAANYTINRPYGGVWLVCGAISGPAYEWRVVSAINP